STGQGVVRYQGVDELAAHRAVPFDEKPSEKELILMSFKSFVGRAVRGVYLRLPLPWKWRLSIKSAIFVVFAPLLRHTNSYHRWRWQH
ncbi:hypothetical protein ABTJ04_19325, partial [Acinetobacter baumannii]